MTKKKSEIKKISVIVPAYKAEKFIVDSLSGIKAVLDKTKYDYEIICVVDGTEKDSTFSVAKSYAKKFPDMVYIDGYTKNLGKGHAVRYGMAKSSGDIVGYVDAGNEINPEGLLLLLEHMKWYQADAIIASKRHPASKVVYPWQRRILSFVYQMFVRFLFGVKVRDTQVGMKFFRRKVLEEVLPRVLVKKFAFDIEILAVANYLGFKKIYESPIELNMKFEGGISTITSKSFINTIFNMVWDTAAVFYRLRILRYYRNSNKENWTTPEHLFLKK